MIIVNIELKRINGQRMAIFKTNVTNQEYLSLKRSRRIVKDLKEQSRKNRKIEVIHEIVCESLDLDKDISKNKKPIRDYLVARRLSYFFMKKYCNKSLSDMGDFFNQDHATALYHIRKAKEFSELYSSFKLLI